MKTLTRTRRRKRVNRDLFKERAERRLDRVYLDTIKAKRFDITLELESVKALAPLYGLPIDGLFSQETRRSAARRSGRIVNRCREAARQLNTLTPGWPDAGGSSAL